MKVCLNTMASSLDKVSSGKVNIRSDGRVIVNDKDLAVYLKETFGYSYQKYIPRNILNECSREQLMCLFESLMVGDGSSKKDGGDYYTTSSVRLRDDFQELLLKVGLSGSFVLGAEEGTEVYFKKEDRVIKSSLDVWKVYVRRHYHEVALSTWDRYKSIFRESSLQWFCILC